MHVWPPSLFLPSPSQSNSFFVLNLSLLGSRLLPIGLRARVGLEIKVEEQHQKRQNVPQIQLGNLSRKPLTIHTQQIDRLGVHGQELNDLEQRQVLLPPDVLGVHGEEVVRVHHGVDGSVQNNSQENVPIVPGVQIKPVHQKDGHVVVHVQERQLLPLLPQDDEDGVGEVEDLGDVEEPEEGGDGRVGGVVRLAGE